MIKKITNLQLAEKYLKDFAPKKIDAVYRLDRMYKLMELLGNPQNELRVIHVAGTSGKTSTSYYIAKMLHVSGKTVGLSVSPHISFINERTQLNGLPLEEKEFCSLLSQFLQIPGVKAVRPTYFEIMVAFTYWVFAKKNVDYAVIEVGLGGLLDGTNVVTRADKVCVITDIDFDHTHILGNTLEKIALQKAGIIQKGNAVFMLQQADEVIATVHGYAAAHEGQLFIHEQSDHVPDGLPLFQRRNWSLAHDVCEYVAARDDWVEADFWDLSLDWSVPGRMETIGNFIIDGAHNPGKFTALVRSLAERFPDQKFNFIIGIKTRKVYVKECMQAIAPLADKVICVPVNAAQDIAYKTLDPDVVAAVCQGTGITNVRVADTLEQAIEAAPKDEVTVITGSLFLLGHAKELLLQDD